MFVVNAFYTFSHIGHPDFIVEIFVVFLVILGMQLELALCSEKSKKGRKQLQDSTTIFRSAAIIMQHVPCIHKASPSLLFLTLIFAHTSPLSPLLPSSAESTLSFLCFHSMNPPGVAHSWWMIKNCRSSLVKSITRLPGWLSALTLLKNIQSACFRASHAAPQPRTENNL